MQLSVEDFENKIQAKPAADCCHWAYLFPFIYLFFQILMSSELRFLFLFGFKQDAIKQTYERSIKAAQDYGIMKENPEFVFLCFEIKQMILSPGSDQKLISTTPYAGHWCMVPTFVLSIILPKP